MPLSSSETNRCGKKAALFQRLSAALSAQTDALRSAATRAALVAFIASAALFHPQAQAVEVLKQASELQPLVISKDTPQSEVIRLARERGAEGKLIGFTVSNTGSMEPVLTTDDLAICEKNPAKITEGDIVVTSVGKRGKDVGGVIHRVVGRNGDRWVTQGDAKRKEDPGTTAKSDILGRVVLVLRR